MVYICAILVVLIIAIIFMPKRLTLKENIIIVPTVGYFAWISHIIVGLILDLYDMGTTKKIDMSDWTLVTFVLSFMAVVFLNFKKTNKLFVYTLFWTVLSALAEFVLTKSGYMKYHGWSIFVFTSDLLPIFYNPNLVLQTNS
ncbi:hypothetical protein [Neobacillus sp. SuZ13]|uniref:hypothetical protein n=1 Tax=Neobacillus sp. SuZ13 TaxID=3047875 RepID=UPI0024C02F2E|nr:hypothetical protein [Neobacillus sp. SuZ13]WHY69367.1 hypothetical protein QNH17_12295 [Neobacillus sp. SuZ13]